MVKSSSKRTCGWRELDWSRVFCLGLLAITVGCSTAQWRHSITLDRYEGRLLHADAGTGAEALAMEEAYDPTIRHFVAQIGPPDYILIESFYVVKLVYIDGERIAIFTRRWSSPSSAISNANGLPDSLVGQFTPADQARLAELRRTTHHTVPSSE